ncbi:hypothetical protein CI610_03510 [invertebrate metagenome]|uniref:Uncharacterized protein n=1 Tax=invertebrate metagenome TaxID=1711999 RepID=A0A2H9T2Z4_9ZZZZ
MHINVSIIIILLFSCISLTHIAGADELHDEFLQTLKADLRVNNVLTEKEINDLLFIEESKNNRRQQKIYQILNNITPKELNYYLQGKAQAIVMYSGYGETLQFENIYIDSSVCEPRAIAEHIP